MKTFLSAVLATVALAELADVSENDLLEWESFKEKYGKWYETASEEEKRKNIFLNHLKFVYEHNAKLRNCEVSSFVDIMKYSDLSDEKFFAMRKCLKFPDFYKRSDKEFTAPDNARISETVDWRTEGAVTPVKNQGECGSCWIFSATGSVEGQQFLRTKELVSLSEQNLVDCLASECKGSLPQTAFRYIIFNKGIDTEESYSYNAKNGTCQYDASNSGATITRYDDIESGSEEQLKQAVALIGPISVAIDANSASFSHYKGGVLDDPTCKSDRSGLSHAVLVVGYGTTDDGTDYWIVKNSWGVDWGGRGYIMMSRNKGNQCGIATLASYPII